MTRAAAPPRPASKWRLLPAEVAALPRTQRSAVIAIAVAACLLRLFFWAYTDRTWEDALITVLHSENFARGLGLTHQHPGFGPVHGFTSPLSVLVPLAADLLHAGWGLPFLKLVSALTAIPTVLLAAGSALGRGLRTNIWLVDAGFGCERACAACGFCVPGRCSRGEYRDTIVGGRTGNGQQRLRPRRRSKRSAASRTTR